MKKESLIIFSSSMMGLLVWISDSAVDSWFFYEGTFLDLLILNVPKHEIYFRLQVILFFTIFGIIVSHLFSKKDQAEKALRISHEKLGKHVVDRTKKLSEANQILNDEIAERVHAEHSLKLNQKMLKAVFDGISDPLILLNKDYEIKMLNNAAYVYYGIKSSQKIKDKKCHEIAVGNSNPCEGCEIARANHSSKSTAFERQGIFNSNNVERVVTYPIFRGNSQLDSILIRISDITERKNFERYLVHSEKMSALGILISSIAHEINNPNNFVTFNVPILKDYIKEIIPIIEDHGKKHPDYEPFNMPISGFCEDLTKIVDNIDHGSKRVGVFVSNLRDYSQQDFGTPLTLVDIKTVIENAYLICKSKIDKEVKSFTTNIPDNIPKIVTNRYAVEQVMVTLLMNASDAIDKKDSWIKVAAEYVNTSKRHLVIKIQDNGIGMDENTRRRIFNPFFSTKPREIGTGLGLYICHNLSKKLGGRIEVESEPDRGTIFQLILPYKDQE